MVLVAALLVCMVVGVDMLLVDEKRKLFRVVAEVRELALVC